MTIDLLITYLSIIRVVPLCKVFKISSLHSHRFAENNKCTVSEGSSVFLVKKLFIISPIAVVLSINNIELNND